MTKSESEEVPKNKRQQHFMNQHKNLKTYYLSHN